MASKETCKLLEKNVEGSYDSISNSGSSEASDEKDNRGLTKSCPAVLEPSKDELRSSDGKPKTLLRKLLTRSCPQPSTNGVSVSSSSESESLIHEDEQETNGEHRTRTELQTDEPPTNCCATFMDLYKTYTHKIGNSWFIFIVQFLIGLVCISAIVMGIIFFQSCEGSYRYTDPFFTILMGISGLLLIYKWMVKVCLQRNGHYYWNHEKNRLILYFAALLFCMALEYMFFSQMSPKILQSEVEVKCTKTYYDYIYYMHFTNAGFLIFAALLYLPDCCVYVYTYRRLLPSHTNGHFQPL